MKTIVSRRSWIKNTTMAALVTLGISFAVPGSEAARSAANINITPTITEIALEDGQLLASGIVTAEVRGQVVTQSFSGIPVTLALAEDQEGAGACPILDLALEPINLNLLGLIVETSPICLKLTAYEGTGLLGDLLCSVAGLLSQGLSLEDILGGVVGGLPALDEAAVGTLLTGLTDLLNGALDQLLDAVLGAITEQIGRDCAILNLALGPIDLNLLGLEVILDDCEGGPVLVDITARRGQLLGNLLCGLLHGGLIDLGATLGEIVGALEAGD